MSNPRYANECPILTGDTVTQGHADYCAEHGHATYTQNGKAVPWCPRCGDNLPSSSGATDRA